MHAHSRRGAFIEGEQKDIRAAGAAGGDHPFAEAELHLPRREIGDHHHQPADEFFCFVSGFDAGEDLSLNAAAQAQFEFRC